MHVSQTHTMSENLEKKPMNDDTNELNSESNADKSCILVPKDELGTANGIGNNNNNDNNNYYIKKRIIAAINRSFKSNSKNITHTFSAEDDEKNDLVKNHQPVTIIVKGIDLDEELIMYTQERDIPGIVNLDLFKIKEVPNGHDSSKHNNSHHSSLDRKRSSDKRTYHHTSSGNNSSDKHHSSSHHRSVSDKKRSSHRISEETLKGPYLLCHGCGRKEEKKWVHDGCKSKCCRSTAYVCDSCVRHKLIRNDHSNESIRNLKYGKYMYVVKCPIGRGCSLHMDYDRITHLRSAEQREVATAFLKQAFKEDDQGFAQYTIAIVHNGARYMPDIIKLMAKSYPNLKVNTTKLKSSTETELTDLLSYYKKVKETYSNGIFSHDPLNETQAACVKNADEYGAYLPELLSLLEKSPFLSLVLPWGDLTTKRFKTPHESDDGPIFWCRPGEQIISLDRNCQRNRWNSGEIESFLKERKKNMNVSEKKLIVEELKKYRRSNSTREVLFEDRTRPHADQAWGNNFEATAAVGVIQAIHPDEHPDFNRICKEIIVFQAKHIEMLEALLHIDFTAAPKQQCAEWLDDAKLNMIRQMKIEFSKTHLRDNDIYFIPRKIVHQFQTTSATLSIAWHTRLKEYYEENPVAKETPIFANSPPSITTVEKTPKNKVSSRYQSPKSRTPQSTDCLSKTPVKKSLSRSTSVDSTPSKFYKKLQRSRSRENHRLKTPKNKAGSASPGDDVRLKTPMLQSESKNLQVSQLPASNHRSQSPSSECNLVLSVNTPKKERKTSQNGRVNDKLRETESGDNAITPKKEKWDGHETVKNGRQGKKRELDESSHDGRTRKKPKEEPGLNCDLTSKNDESTPINVKSGDNANVLSPRVEIVDIKSRLQSNITFNCDQSLPIKTVGEDDDRTDTECGVSNNDDIQTSEVANNVNHDEDKIPKNI